MPHCYETCSPGPTATIPLHQMPTTIPDFQRRLMAPSHNHHHQSITTFLQKLTLWNDLKVLWDFIKYLLFRLNNALPPSIRRRVYFYSLQPEVQSIPLPALNIGFVKMDTRPNGSSVSKMILRSLLDSDSAAMNQLILSVVIVVIVQFVMRTFFLGRTKGWLDEKDGEIGLVVVIETSKALGAAGDVDDREEKIRGETEESCLIGEIPAPAAEELEVQIGRQLGIVASMAALTL